jgi:Tfp pilus assembly protein PilN
MADIDMIPRSYRDALRVRRTLTAYGAALALLVVGGGGASLVLRWRVAVETPRLERMRTDSGMAGTMRTQLIGMQQRKDALMADAQAFASLRGAGDTAAVAQVLEATLNDKVWLGQLRFTRTQEHLHEPLPSPLPPGTVFARATAPAGAPAPAPGSPGAMQAWQLGSHIELSGQALDQRAMTDFLAALAAHPALNGVRFLNSSQTPAEAGDTMAFSAGASLAPRKETP